MRRPQVSLRETLEPLSASQVVERAKEAGITRLVFFPDFIGTFREVKNGGATGPHLTDFEAAVLIADGMPWSVYEPWRRS